MATGVSVHDKLRNVSREMDLVWALAMGLVGDLASLNPTGQPPLDPCRRLLFGLARIGMALLQTKRQVVQRVSRRLLLLADRKMSLSQPW